MEEKFNVTTATDVLRAINVASAAIMMFTLIVRYRYSYLERYTQVGLFAEDRYLDTRDYIGYFSEVFINCFFLPPAVSAYYQISLLGGTYDFKVDSLVAICSLLRIYHFVRLYVHYSVWFTGETQLICKKFGFIPDLYFVVKTELKQRPFTVLVTMMISMSIIAALIIQSCEWPY